MESNGQKDSHVLAHPKREIDRDYAPAVNLRGLPTDPWPVDRADSPRSDDLDRWFTTVTQEADESWSELIKVEEMNAGVAIVSIGLLVLTMLIGFAIVCWQGIGWAYESILMAN